VTEEKNPLPQFRRPRDRATFGILSWWNQVCLKPSFPLIMIKRLRVYV